MQLDVVRGGKAVLVVRHPDTLTMRIARAWTDADGNATPPGEEMETQLTINSIRDLIHLLDSLLERS